jgi:hypothetical protein
MKDLLWPRRVRIQVRVLYCHVQRHHQLQLRHRLYQPASAPMHHSDVLRRGRLTGPIPTTVRMWSGRLFQPARVELEPELRR